MPDPIHGKNVSISMLVSSVYYPILCGTDCTYQCAAEFIEKTGPNSGGSRQWMRRLEEHTSSVTGLTKVNNDTSLTFFYMLQVGIRRQEQTFKMTFADELGNFISLTGPGLIGTQNINGPINDFSNASIEIRWNGDGGPSMAVIPAPAAKVVQNPLYITVVAGASSVSNALLIGATILEVEREGIGHDEVSGTPVNRQFQFTSGTGTISFDPAIPFNAGEVIYILYEI